MLKLNKIYKFNTVLEILQDAILFGDIEPGTVITQSDVASSLNVSRMPVREAFIALEYCGLVERLPGQHIKVLNLDDEIIKSIFSDMTFSAIKIIESFNSLDIKNLAECESQGEFHDFIIKKIKSSLQKKFFEIIEKIYLSFVLKYSENLTDVNKAFKHLLAAIKNSDAIKSAYLAYGEVLTFELIKIRKRKREQN